MSTITIKVKLPKQEEFTVEVSSEGTVKDLKDAIAQKCDTPAERQRVIFTGKVLKDNLSLVDYKITDGLTVHMVPSASPSAASASTPAPASSIPSPSFQAPPAGAAGNPFAAFGGAGGMGGLPGMNNPAFMRQMMESPMVRSLLSNPEFIRSQMQNNPMMRNLMETNPEVAQMMNNPGFIDQAVQMIQNPDLMRETMRNNDRTMLNVENLPGGFDMLRQQYQNIVEPMMNAQQESVNSMIDGNNGSNDNNNSGSNQGANSNNGAGPNTQPLPNPWEGQQGAAAGGMPDLASMLNAMRSPPAGSGAASAAPGSGAAPSGLPDMSSFMNMFGGAGAAAQGNPAAGPAAGAPPASPFGGLPFSPAALQSMMSNPMVQQTMQQMSQNPELLRSMVQNNPLVQQMSQNNPVMQNMLQNPDLLASMMNPNALQGMFGGAGFPGAAAPAAAAPGAAPAGMPDFSSLFGAFGGAGAGAGGAGMNASPASQEPASVRYAAQIQQLKDMGFYDEQASARVLQETDGNIHAAVERLLRFP